MSSPVQSPPVTKNSGLKSLQDLLGEKNSSTNNLKNSPTPKSNPASTQPLNNNLDTFGEVLDELGAVAPQSVVAAVDQALTQTTGTLNPANPTRSSKEKTESTSALDSSSPDTGSGVQVVEHERVPEIPVEVESFLHRVEDHQDQAPHEIVIADGTVETSKANYPSTPVVVLPITQKEEKKGQRKSPKNSFRWLVEWSHKVMKLFAGKVIYKEEVQA